jgi:hypothetical protein
MCCRRGREVRKGGKVAGVKSSRGVLLKGARPPARPPARPRLTRGGQRNARRDDALDGGVVGQVEEEDGALQGAVLLKILFLLGGWVVGAGRRTVGDAPPLPRAQNREGSTRPTSSSPQSAQGLQAVETHLLEEVGGLHVDAHGGENDGKLRLLLALLLEQVALPGWA